MTTRTPRRTALATLAIAAAIGALTSDAHADRRASGVSPPLPINDAEPNDAWAIRTTITGAPDAHFVATCIGRLGAFDPRQPDTALCITLNHTGWNVANDDGDWWAELGGSGRFYIQPALGAPGAWDPIPRIAVAGKGSYAGNSTTVVSHGQVGPFECVVNFYNDLGQPVGHTILDGELTGGASEVEFIDIPVPGATSDFDVIVNPLADERGDVDFYELSDLRPDAPYTLTARGIDAREAVHADLIIGAWDTAAPALLATNDDICNTPGCGPYDPGSTITVNADAAGRIVFAVTGWDDFNFDGRRDARAERHPWTGAYVVTIAHQCDIPEDVNHDGAVNFDDLNLMLQRWGDACE